MKNMNEMKAERVKISKNYRERANEEFFSIINTLHNGKDVIREKWTIVDEKVNGESSNFVDAFRNRLGKNETCQIAPVTAELYFSKWVNNNFELSSSADYILKTVGTTWYHMRCLVHFHHHQQQSVTLYFAYNKYVSMERVCVCMFVRTALWRSHTMGRRTTYDANEKPEIQFKINFKMWYLDVVYQSISFGIHRHSFAFFQSAFCLRCSFCRD